MENIFCRFCCKSKNFVRLKPSRNLSNFNFLRFFERWRGNFFFFFSFQKSSFLTVFATDKKFEASELFLAKTICRVSSNTLLGGLIKLVINTYHWKYLTLNSMYLYLLTFRRKVFDINALISTHDLYIDVKFWLICINFENLTSNEIQH